jgi:hypothetical protein
LRIGGVALTTATATAGAVFLLRAHVVHSNLREANGVRRAQGCAPDACRAASAPAACAEIQGQAKERDMLATLGKVSLAASAVFGIATAASFFFHGGRGLRGRAGNRRRPPRTGDDGRAGGRAPRRSMVRGREAHGLQTELPRSREPSCSRGRRARLDRRRWHIGVLLGELRGSLPVREPSSPAVAL